MIKVVQIPIAVVHSNYELEEEFNKRIEAMQALEEKRLVELGQALDDGFYIVHSHETTVNRMIYLRYTLHQFKSIIPPYES